jgi:hypothetical protein
MKLTTKFLLEALFLTFASLILWVLSLMRITKIQPTIAFISVLGALLLVLNVLYMKYLENRGKDK